MSPTRDNEGYDMTSLHQGTKQEEALPSRFSFPIVLSSHTCKKVGRGPDYQPQTRYLVRFINR